MRWVNPTRSACALVAAIALLSFPGFALAQITGSSHDFSGTGWAGGEICIVCHTPHNADTTVSLAPLWNHELTTATYTLYSSATLDATPGQPAGISKLCLSCHDGTVGLDAFGQPPSAGTVFMASTDFGYVGVDLSNDHPISFAYTDGLDPGLHDPSTTLAGLPGSSGFILDEMLFGGNLECASCHDPHDALGVGAMLVKSNASSDLCLTCHNK